MKNIKKIIKLELGIVVFALFFAAALNVNGTTINGEEIASTNMSEKISEQIISVPGSEIILTLWEEQLESGEILPFYSISLDGGETVVRTVQPSYELGLRYAYFDPLVDVPSVESNLEADTDTNLYIVQFVTQPLEEFREAITGLGGTIRQYIAQYAHLVEMSEEVISQVESLPYVRWVGPYHPAYRLEEFMLDNYENAEEVYPLLRYNIQVHTVEQKDILATKVTEIGGIIDTANFGKKLISVTLTPEQLFAVVRFDEVNYIDRWSDYEVDMDIGREIGGANYIESVGGFDGTDVRGESFDTGFNLNHVDFQNHPLIVHGPYTGSDSHGTATIGICFGDGTGNADARGLCPDGQGIVADYSVIGLEGQNRYDHSGELIEDPYYAVFQTSSVGSGRTSQYTTVSADTDQAIFDFDLVHCQSQSNAGTQQSRPQAWAKNMVSGGAVYHYDTLDKSDDMWNYGASIGPASDGRIKPTFAFFYDDILTVGYPGNNDYTYGFGGTSGATPMIAGHVGLFFEMWDAGIFGNDVSPGGSVFENKAHFTTAKAMLINSAEQYDFTGTTGDKTRMHQGWGMPDLQKMYDLRDDVLVIDEEDILDPLEVAEHILTVESGAPELKVTMSYSDTPGNPAVQSQHRINDLTLKVISPSGDEYWGNHGLLEGVWSETGGAADDKNTVECVFVENPEGGAWTIQVHADEIIEDTHVETPELDADYALVAAPVLSGPLPPAIDGPTEGDIGIEYEYTFMSEDPAGEDLYYWINWDDGTYEEWIGPYDSGEVVTVAHTWFERDNYSLKAKAKNTLDVEGGLSSPFYVNIAASKVDVGLITGGFLYAKAAIYNIGLADAYDVEWTLTLDGGWIFLGKQSSGSIDIIPANGSVTVNSNIIIGIGETKYTVTASEPFGSTDFRSQGGRVLGIYVHVNPGGG